MNPEDLLRGLKDPDRWMNVRVPRARPTQLRSVTPARAVQFVAAFAIAVLAVTGILVGLEVARHSAPPAATTTPSALATASTIPSSLPTAASAFEVVPGVRHEYTTTVLPPTCTLGQLATASKQDGGGAGGSYIQTISLRNEGTDCVLGTGSIAVRIGGVALYLEDSVGLRVVPAQATASFWISTATACAPSMSTINVDASKPVLPITLEVDASTRTMTARFPKWSCAAPSVRAALDPSVVFDVAVPAPQATVDQPSATPAGPLEYGVVLVNPGTTAIAACPSATEVLDDGHGRIVTRALTLRCPAGATLQPGLPVHLSVTTTVPAQGDWTITWYLGGTYGAGVATFTCTADQLRAAEPDESGGAAGIWVQLVTVRNTGEACVLPVQSFSIDGRAARGGNADTAGGILLRARSTTKLVVAVPNTCLIGRSAISASPSDKPVVLTVGGKELDGLDRPFPPLHCDRPFVDLLN